MRHRISLVVGAAALLALVVAMTPAPLRADGEVSQAIKAICEFVASDPDAEPNCKGQCVSTLHVCFDEQTGDFLPSTQCFKHLAKAIEACNL